MNLTDALLELHAQRDTSGTLYTSSPDVNSLFSGRVSPTHYSFEGLERGSVVELTGPPGSGKTAIALELTADALSKGHRVLWMTSSGHASLPLARLAGQAKYDARTLRLLSHMSVTVLSQLILAFKKPAPPPTLIDEDDKEQYSGLVPEGTRLIVVDDFSSLLTASYPVPARSDHKKTREVAMRRGRALMSLLSNIRRLAKTRGVSVLLLGKLVSQYSFSKHCQLLVPPLGDGPWLQELDSQIVLYKDIPSLSVAISSTSKTMEELQRELQQDQHFGKGRVFPRRRKLEGVNHAARIRNIDDFDPAVIHKSRVVLFDVECSGVVNHFTGRNNKRVLKGGKPQQQQRPREQATQEEENGLELEQERVKRVKVSAEVTVSAIVEYQLDQSIETPVVEKGLEESIFEGVDGLENNGELAPDEDGTSEDDQEASEVVIVINSQSSGEDIFDEDYEMANQDVPCIQEQHQEDSVPGPAESVTATPEPQTFIEPSSEPSSKQSSEQLSEQPSEQPSKQPISESASAKSSELSPSQNLASQSTSSSPKLAPSELSPPKQFSSTNNNNNEEETSGSRMAGLSSTIKSSTTNHHQRQHCEPELKDSQGDSGSLSCSNPPNNQPSSSLSSLSPSPLTKEFVIQDSQYNSDDDQLEQSP